MLQTEGVCSFNVFLPYTVLVKHVMSYGVPASSLSVQGEEGEFKGLYRGASSSFVGMAFESSLPFGLYSQTKQSLQGGLQSDAPRPQVIIPSAAYGGAYQLLIMPIRASKSIFRGGFTTLLRESIGNAVFFSVYEYVHRYMRLQLKPTLSDHSNLVDMGIGILTGGLGGIAVFLICCFAYGCGENHYPDIS
ncbi:hypothetical protein POTOM_015116 [Populus tomentosa]|uniref:Mitochondrial substrate carrier family protein n=1 Tax=Populus tomentosa TaxID=118781 RepID=A0A8X8A1B6_POPTO|nr:hypothetical protein POTOM_015116 [Populus tomentosa]